ncbi:uncharacterized protein LOC110457378 [Mizuhopecten yessoensis]|uniref:Extracellular matrix protein FRAS1 n=1 Tax=Mizuhopecten yessoensis TaxID=6573 RepID=A0A210Q8X7_MIZYE|nr:uncharacterized protein LOC110457378 [Mizuhopecten yessoensis]OWF45202.1 Extracellular matrix protein FRAS1 [Mizuhopecten yessoensis]
MGNNSLLIRVTLAVVVHVLGMMTSSEVMLDGQRFFCNSTANITSECCLHCDLNATCNNTCPPGQLTHNLTKSFPSCIFTNDNDSNAMSSEDQSRDFVVVCVTMCPVGYYPDVDRCKKCDDVCDSCTGPGIKDNCTCPLRNNSECVNKCDEGFYNNDNGSCAKCDNACNSCNASGSRVDTCDCKFEFNGTCYVSCQPNITSCENEGEDDLLLIIGIAVGGGVFVIIIIVVIVIIVVRCCRRKGKSKSRMSTIIENRNADGDEEEQVGGVRLPVHVKGKRPGKYENVELLGSNVSKQAQDTQDKKTRYTTDPTLPRGASLEDPPDRTSGWYANAGAIKLNQNLAKGEGRDTKLNRGVFNKFKKSLMGRKSKKQEDNSKSKSGTTNPVFSDNSSEGGTYCDMSRKTNGDTEQEDYVEVTRQADDEPQEDYENVEKIFKANLRDYESQDDYENFSNTPKANLNDDEPQDDYENFEHTSKDRITDDEPQEEYENFQYNPTVNTTDEEPQDDYENFGQTSAPAMEIDGRGTNDLYQEEESPYINVKEFKKKS